MPDVSQRKCLFIRARKSKRAISPANRHLSLEAQRVAAVAAVETAEASLKRVIAYRREEDEVNLQALLAQAKALQVGPRTAWSEAQLAATGKNG